MRAAHEGASLMDGWTDDQIIASAARFLIDGHEELAANVLLSCTLSSEWTEWEPN